MNQLCGNTQAEIAADRQAVIPKEDWELRHERLEMQLQARKVFISTLLRNEAAYVNGQPYFLHEAIAEVKDELLWDYLIKNDDDLTYSTFAQAFEEDPELLCKMFVDGHLDQFKILIQHEVEKLADCVRF